MGTGLKLFTLRKAREELTIWHTLFQILKGILKMGPNCRIGPKDLFLYLALLYFWIRQYDLEDEKWNSSS